MMFDLPEEVLAYRDDPSATLVVDGEGVIVVFNEAAELMLGYSAGEVVGEFVEHLLPPDRRWTHLTWRRAYMNDMTEREMDPDLAPQAQTRDGGLIPIAVTLVPLDIGGGRYVVARLTPGPDR